MKKILFYAVLLLSLSSCGKILIPEMASVKIDVGSVKADVFDEDGKKLGTTPTDISLKNKSKYTLTLKAEGYVDYELFIKPTPNNGVLALNALGFGIPSIVDLPQKSYLYHKKTLYLVEMEKERTSKKSSFSARDDSKPEVAKKEQLPVYLEIGMVKLPKISSTKKGSGEKLSVVPESVYEEFKASRASLVDVVCSEISSSKVKVSKCGNEEQRSTMRKMVGDESVLKVETKILDISASKESKDSYLIKGKVEFTVTNETEEEVYKVAYSVSGFTSSPEFKKYGEVLMAKAAEEFKDDAEFQKAIKKHADKEIANKIGESMAIKPAPLAIEGMKADVSILLPSVVTILTDNKFGSGFVVDKRGYIITNYHVIEGEDTIEVKLNNGKKIFATVAKYNPIEDLALLKVESNDLLALSLRKTIPNVGTEVIAIGTPYDRELAQTVTKGIVSGIRELGAYKFIQFDASVNSGNSGGPLFDNRGNVIGVVTWKISSSGRGRATEGLSFAIPIEQALEHLNLIVE